MDEPAKRVYVAEDDTGSVVASAYVTPTTAAPPPASPTPVSWSTPTGPDGTGRALAEYVLDAARAEGYRGMVFNAVVETNPAVRLWTSLGFTILGTVPDAFEHPRHGRVSLHVMHRALPAPQSSGAVRRQGRSASIHSASSSSTASGPGAPPTARRRARPSPACRTAPTSRASRSGSTAA